MKKTKKLISVILSLLLVLGMMSTFAFAETPDYSITINDTRSGRTYIAYQILKGDSVSDKSLGNVQWGYNMNITDNKIKIGEGESEESYTAAEFAEYLNENSSSIKTLAKTIDGLRNNNEGFCAIENKNNETGTITEYKIDLTVKNAGIGYYLVLEIGDSGEYDEFSDFIIKVVGSATANPKIADQEDGKIPTIDKTPATQSVSVGENANFELTATLPTNLDDYSSYKLVFNDTLSEDLTYNDDLKVYVINTTKSDNETESDTRTLLDKKSYSVVGPTTGSNTVTITLNDVKTLLNTVGDEVSSVTVDKDSKILVTYSAKVTKASTNETTFVAATNEVCLNYSNDPKDSDRLGKTDEKTVEVTNTKIVINKVEGKKSRALDGAGFALYKAANANAESFDAEKDGAYVILNPSAKSVSERGSLTESVENSDIWDTFTFTGLGEGTYWLVESTTPDGYNTLEPVKIVITSTYNNEDGKLVYKYTLDGKDFNGNANNGENEEKYNDTVNTAKIANNKGAQLPETGGIGTTIFYIAGAILVIGAGVVFVTRRRMHSDN